MKSLTRCNVLLAMTIVGSTLLMSSNSNAATPTPQGAKTGYEVDGRTSASVLAAKRSHEVKDQDKFGLGLYSGIFIIGLIIFFAQEFRNR